MSAPGLGTRTTVTAPDGAQIAVVDHPAPSGSPGRAGRVPGASIAREERKGKGARDRAPVIVGLDGADGAPGEVQ